MTDKNSSPVGREMEMLYGELRRIAGAQLRRERPDHTLSATALVHEAYLSLAKAPDLKWQSIAHFRALAAKAMRQILVNHALAHRAEKRGGDWLKLTLTGAVANAVAELSDEAGDDADILGLDDALKELARVDERQAQIVELRYFGGLSIEETADAISLSPATVKREWAVARLFLKRAMSRNEH